MVKLINRTCDVFFNYFQFGAHKNSGRLQIFLCFLNVFFSIWPLTCWFLYSKDIHVVYWLGKLPQWTNLSVPFSLLALNLGVNYFQCFTVRAKAARAGCVSLFVVLGLFLIVLGMLNMIEAQVRIRGEVRMCSQSSSCQTSDT